MGLFSPTNSSRRHRRGSEGHGSGHRSSGHRHGKASTTGHGSHGSHGGSGGTSSSSSSRTSRTSERARRRSPAASSATADDGSVATTTATTPVEEQRSGESGSGEEESEEDSEEDDEEEEEEDEEDDPPYTLDYDYADDDADPTGDALSQQVRAHVFENGLRYHAFRAPASAARPAGGKLYALPNDEVEQNRDDMKHAVTVQLMRGELFYAPVAARLAAGGVVYDLGTGTGIWAIEVGDKYPNSVVHGVDLSPIQPNYVPRNVYFVVDDFEDDWDAPPAAFDFVHMRHSLWAVDDRPALLRRIFHHLKPGGYVEFQEFVPELCFEGEEGGGGGSTTGGGGGSSGSSSSTTNNNNNNHRSSTTTTTTSKHRHHRHRSQHPPEPPAPNAYRDFLQYIAMGMQQSAVLAGGDLLGEAPAAEDRDPSPAARLDRALAADLAAAGFRAARSATHRAPLGDWPARHHKQRRHHHHHNHHQGALLQRAVLDGLRGWAARPLGSAAGGLGWTPTQIEIYLVYVRKALADPAARAYLPLHVTYAQKPE